MMLRKTVYLLLFIIAMLVAVTVFYIEIRIVSEMHNFAEPIYNLPQYNLRLKGTSAALAHFINIVFGFISVIVAALCFKEIGK
ncbi:MAG: hypothetical protein AAFZ92_07285 [Pseudomonadota bacterium]